MPERWASAAATTFTASIDNLGPWYGSARLRYFGPRALIEDNSVRSGSTTLLSGRVGYKVGKSMRLQLDVFNLLNREASQISYYYNSRILQGDPVTVGNTPGGVPSVHFHPVEPRSFRIAAILNF